MKDNAVFIYSDELLHYKFADNHPFNQKRLLLTVDLLHSLDFLAKENIVAPRYATEEELLLIHDGRYIEAVKKAGEGLLKQSDWEKFGLGTEDTPIFSKMHEASSLIVGGTLTAVDAVMSGNSLHALHLGGGLHHSLPGKASGFCIYNDCAVAIQYLRKKYNAKVLYIDTDAHHGDGVQWSFYDDPNVCVVSIHETGRYLFPGTGAIYERGHGHGYGYTFNVPLDAFTEDDSWLEAYSAVLTAVADYFKPDILLTQNGVDAHYYDPLTHLSTTIAIYREIPKFAHEIAHRYCEGRWVAVGGGGYDIWRVVPRAWSYLWFEMNDQRNITGEIPADWLHRWQPEAPVALPTNWEDPTPLYPAIPRKNEIEQKNKKTVETVLQIIHNHSS
ncbi:acetoin utilization protein AcuC [Caldibacillus lycopersici]|uniref:Acetoin utilization protein AcuC n=1 Tax=Perspicuibacillus lycopersici TaxID=1325689 RepID=A0AAE3LNU5_9BACI|nr:acetoin utilization protein AcuC [Perspicuibacillus lycopersici]MCU9614232.1 acetoin utilization protein AcuC [Perspicuibacillus lycopersici]